MAEYKIYLLRAHYMLDSVLSALHLLTYLIAYTKAQGSVFQKIKESQCGCWVASEGESGTSLGIWSEEEPDCTPYRLCKGFWILF